MMVRPIWLMLEIKLVISKLKCGWFWLQPFLKLWMRRRQAHPPSRNSETDMTSNGIVTAVTIHPSANNWQTCTWNVMTGLHHHHDRHRTMTHGSSMEHSRADHPRRTNQPTDIRTTTWSDETASTIMHRILQQLKQQQDFLKSQGKGVFISEVTLTTTLCYVPDMLKRSRMQPLTKNTSPSLIPSWKVNWITITGS